ncbi:hypothetical protein NQ318_018895 [Aromia moschata]|uniref:Uncharacterized protein n=1 Tax=Aromia moschata TaxID=1265417 RepID=A0AAV8ZHK6_9CUCU|nr:hypothetical protein NQ318_018895 [Aromia moschata]
MPTFITPIAYIKNKQQAWQKIDDKGWKPQELDAKEEINFFNTPQTSKKRMCEYDLFFSYAKAFPLWDQRKNRENRQFLRDIHENIFREEENKPIPVLTSLNYGRPCRVQYDEVETKYRRQTAISDFMRRQGGVIRVKEKRAV